MKIWNTNSICKQRKLRRRCTPTTEALKLFLSLAHTVESAWNLCKFQAIISLRARFSAKALITQPQGKVVSQYGMTTTSFSSQSDPSQACWTQISPAGGIQSRPEKYCQESRIWIDFISAISVWLRCVREEEEKERNQCTTHLCCRVFHDPANLIACWNSRKGMSNMRRSVLCQYL